MPNIFFCAIADRARSLVGHRFSCMWKGLAVICKKPGYHRPPKNKNKDRNKNTNNQTGVPRHLGEKVKHTRPIPLLSAVLLFIPPILQQTRDRSNALLALRSSLSLQAERLTETLFSPLKWAKHHTRCYQIVDACKNHQVHLTGKHSTGSKPFETVSHPLSSRNENKFPFFLNSAALVITTVAVT